jgi:hypothetical protein
MVNTVSGIYFLREESVEPRDFYRINPQSLLWREGKTCNEDEDNKIMHVKDGLLLREGQL